MSRDRRVGWWLAIWSVMVLFTVVIGGVTRLTESGLSITEWRPITGVLPPIGQEAWEAEFAKYRQIPEFQIEAPTMTVDGFKRIFFWEYLHRLWARVVGLAIALPALIGLARRWFTPPVRARVVTMALLTAGQGALGWFMVRSGLTERTDVSQYRLAAHLSLALVIFGIAVWTATDLLVGRERIGSGRIHRQARWNLAAVSLTVLAGAFVAGTNAGKVYNEFPLMAGRLVPAGYLSLRPAWRNLFDNVAAVQFNHRLLAVLVLAVAGWLAVRLGQEAGRAGRRLAVSLIVVVTAQFGLGLWTLLRSVPVAVAAFHQAGAVTLLGLALLIVHRTRPNP